MRAAILFISAFVSFAGLADAGVELALRLDLAKRNSYIAWNLTQYCDTQVRTTVVKNGEDFNLDGWSVYLVLGGADSGVAAQGVISDYNELVFTLPATSLPTNGKYTVQVSATKDRRSEEWGSGTVRVKLNPSVNYMPTSWVGYEQVAKVAATLIADRMIDDGLYDSVASNLLQRIIGEEAAQTNLCIDVLKSNVAEVPTGLRFVETQQTANGFIYSNAAYTNITFVLPANRRIFKAEFSLATTNGVEVFTPTKKNGAVRFKTTSTNNTSRIFYLLGGWCSDAERNECLGR